MTLSCRLVTVVLPTRNRQELLKEAVASVLSQSESGPSLLVVDDASEDDTPRWLRMAASGRLRTLTQPCQRERGAARSLGLRHVATPFVMFLDDDDLLRPGAVRSLLAGFRRYPQATASVGASMIFDDRGRRTRKLSARWGCLRDVFPDIVAGWCPAQGQVLYRTAALRECGGWDEQASLLEDYQLWFRFSRLGRVALSPAVTVDVRAHPGQSRRDSDPMAVDAIVRRLLREAVVGSLPSGRHRVERMLSARDHWDHAHQALGEGRHREALAAYLRAAVWAPGWLLSPIVGPLIVTGALDAARGALACPASGGGRRNREES